MKITVAIVTRDRPAALIGSVMSMWRLRSGHHEIHFALGLDADDDESHKAFMILYDEKVPLRAASSRRPDTRGHAVNKLMRVCMGADVITIPADWQFCITPAWDDILAQSSQMHPDRVLWWSHPDNLACITPVIPSKWLAAIDWKLSPEIFPFWWDDTWLEEVDAIMSGGPSLKVPASLAGIHGKTTRGRDFAFWGRVFSSTRYARIVQAERMAALLGLPPPQISADLLTRMHANDRFQQDKADEFERIFGDGSEPTESYLKVKSAALRLIEQPAMAGAAA